MREWGNVKLLAQQVAGMVFVMMGGNALGAHLQLPAEATRPRRAGELPPCALNASPQRPNSAPTAPPFAYVKRAPLRPLRAPGRFRNPKIGQQLGAQPTPRFRMMIEAMTEAMIEAMIDVEIDAVIDPWPPFTFCCPQAIVDQDAGV